MSKQQINIEHGRYWDRPWGLVSSCTRCSPGCQNCWALAMEKRFHKGIEGKIMPHPERLEIPLKRKRPTVYAVWNDLFHEDVSDGFIENALAVMTNCPQHTFLVLTKRAKHMAETMQHDYLRISRTDTWPIKNLWNGITICNQPEADEKIPVFLQVPGKKFLSIEPMLGAVDARNENDIGGSHDWLTGVNYIGPLGALEEMPRKPSVDLVILGGETGPGARPLHPDWVRSIRDQCQAAEVPFFFKQWGECCAYGQMPEDTYREWDIYHGTESWNSNVPRWRVGRKKAGRILDGRTHDDLPWSTGR